MSSQVLMMVKTESEADLAYLDKLIARNPEYTKRDLSDGVLFTRGWMQIAYSVSRQCGQ